MSTGERSAGRRSRRGDDGIVIIYWRDIPAQVNAGAGAARTQRILPRRFQRSIDRAAMVAGKSEASQYIGEWRRVALPGAVADPADAAHRTADEIEAAFPLERLNRFVATGGFDPEKVNGFEGFDRDLDLDGRVANPGQAKATLHAGRQIDRQEAST